MTDEQIRILRHTLGADSKKPGYRNGYSAPRGGEAWPHLMALVESGLMEQGRESESLVVFHATERAQRLLGVFEQD